MTSTQILSGKSILQKIERLALQILEQNYTEQEIILAAIMRTGELICEHLKKHINLHSKIVCSIIHINIDKTQPQNVSIPTDMDYNKKVVIIVDDVSMTGRIISYAMKPFLYYYPSKIQTLVLIERQQKNFPIHSDYVGLHISTTLQETILVHQKDGEFIGASLD
jgi:pyrimidine operon attenuation protein/uracil phosphoribosyltransferase